MKYGMVSALALMAAMFAGSAMAEECTVKVGAVLPTSIDWGRPIAESARFAADQVNEAGGVGGCKVDLILRDGQSDPKVGVDAAKALVDLDGVRVLLGDVPSGVTIPILTTVAVPAGVLQISCCSASGELTKLAQEGKTKGLWFRLNATTDIQAAVTAEATKAQGLKSVAILYKNDDWGQDYAKRTTKYLEHLGIKVTASVAINEAQPSYRAEVTEALKGQPEGMVGILYPTEGGVAIREWLSLGGPQKMVLSNSLKSEDLLKAVGGKYLAEAIGVDNAPPRVESAKAFAESYKKRFNAEPNGPGLPNSYDATMIALLAMQAAGKDATGAEIAAQVRRVTDASGVPVSADAAGFKKAAEALAEGKAVSYQGATGAVAFDANGDVGAPAVFWKFNDTGTEETRYLPMEEVNALLLK